MPLPPSSLPLSAPAVRPSLASQLSYLFRPACALFLRPCRPSMLDTTQAHSTLHLWGRAALWQHAAAPRLAQCPRALRAGRLVVGHHVTPFSALPSRPSALQLVRAQCGAIHEAALPFCPPLCPGPLALSCPLSACPLLPCAAPRPWLLGLRPPVSLSPSSLHPLGVHRAEQCARQPCHSLSPLLPRGVLSSRYVARTLYRTRYLRGQAA